MSLKEIQVLLAKVNLWNKQNQPVLCSQSYTMNVIQSIPLIIILHVAIITVRQRNVECLLVIPFVNPVTSFRCHGKQTFIFHATPTDNNQGENDVEENLVKRTTFDEAGKSLVTEEDNKRMEAMGDYDLNPDAKQDNIDKMREAIRQRTAEMGLEKSKVSADYIQQKQSMAISAGSARAAAEQTSSNMFAGLDLSQISDGTQVKRGSTQSLWGDDDEDTPSMFFDPEDKLSEDERAEIDPIMKKGIVEQGLNELQNAKWPDWASALREVALMVVVIAVSGTLIIGWDKVLRTLYTDYLHFIPSKEELANYASRFDGLDLPKGWTDNMNEKDVSRFTETVTTTLQQGSISPQQQTDMGQIPNLPSL